MWNGFKGDFLRRFDPAMAFDRNMRMDPSYLARTMASTRPMDQRTSVSSHRPRTMVLPSTYTESERERNLSRKTRDAGIDEVGSFVMSMEPQVAISRSDTSARSIWTTGSVSGGSKRSTRLAWALRSRPLNAPCSWCPSGAPALLDAALFSSWCSVSSAPAAMSSTMSSQRWWAAMPRLFMHRMEPPPSMHGRVQCTSRQGQTRQGGCSVLSGGPTAASTEGVSRSVRDICVARSFRMRPCSSPPLSLSCCCCCIIRNWQSTRHPCSVKWPFSCPCARLRLILSPLSSM
mmetsp:Transcript_38310/g.109368  ORF Transcript_38310/g.109368 Transcript_38310/m.109368 type:complete len:289 (-) Transcript_38310:2365-3231(-)